MVKKKKQEKQGERQELENIKNQLHRALADYQNLEKRVAQEKEELIKSSNRGLILRLLPALDALLLAQKHSEDEGLMLSIKQIFDTLQKEGLEKIETEREAFNPEYMEAVQVAEGEEGKIIEELRSGYIFNDKVLRPAQVTVGNGKLATGN